MKSILVVSTAFAPENAIGAIRVSKLVKYLVRLGHPVTVISPELANDVSRDESLEGPELAAARRCTVSQGRLFDSLVAGRRRDALKGGSGVELVKPGPQHGFTARAKTAVYRHIRFVYLLVRNVDWCRQVVGFVSRRPELGHFDVVLSSYPSLGGMWAARELKRRGIADYWIADFRDPVNYRTGAGSLIYRFNTWIQRGLLRSADQVTAISNGVASKLRRGGARSVEVVYNGFDPEDWAAVSSDAVQERSDGFLRLCYTGSLYGGARDVSVVFRALRELVDAKAIPPGGVRFSYAGNDFSSLATQAAKHGMEDILEDHGRIPRSVALALLASSDVAVVATWNTAEEQGIMTGKVFECFMTGTPILGVVNGTLAGSEFADVVESAGAGMVFEEAAPDREEGFEALSRFLLQRYAVRERRGQDASANRDTLLDFSYPRLAAKISSLVQLNGR